MNAVGWQGAEITGSDLRGPFDAAFRARALETLHAHKTVCYRDPDLTDAQFRDFALLFGPLEPRIAAYDRGERFQDLHLMTNVAADGTLSAGHQDTANRGWHSDKSYKTKPSMTTLFYALAVPNEGGETEFADTEAAYAALPDATKQRIAGLEGTIMGHREEMKKQQGDFAKMQQDMKQRIADLEDIITEANQRIGSQTTGHQGEMKKQQNDFAILKKSELVFQKV